MASTDQLVWQVFAGSSGFCLPDSTGLSLDASLVSLSSKDVQASSSALTP